jgi:selT/selW/selH-like putative selenoprotein
LAAKIRDATGDEAKLIAGDKGIFDVTRDGKLLFSKHAEGRFPEEAEILQQLKRSRRSADGLPAPN